MIREALQEIKNQEQQQHQEAFSAPGQEASPVINPAVASDRGDINWMVKRFKRDISGVGSSTYYDHPTIMSNDDKEIAGVKE